MIGFLLLLIMFMMANAYIVVVIWGEVIEIHKLINRYISENKSKKTNL